MQIMEDGHVDVEKLEETFLAKADSSWKPVALAAVDKCKKEMAGKIIKEEHVERPSKLAELFQFRDQNHRGGRMQTRQFTRLVLPLPRNQHGKIKTPPVRKHFFTVTLYL
jgi:hypothetical protein